MKERRVVFSLKADTELQELYEWIATAASPDAAFGYVTRIEDFCQRLGMPLNGASLVTTSGLACALLVLSAA